MSFTHVLLTAWLAASGADAASTALVLHRGGVEKNPMLFGSPSAVVYVKVGSGLAGAVWAHRLERSHPRVVRWVAFGAATVYTAATIHNARIVGALSVPPSIVR